MHRQLAKLDVNSTPAISHVTAKLFEMMGDLQFPQCIALIKQYGKRTHGQDELVSSLKRFVSCENMYYSAYFGNSSNNKQDLHALYSILSSNLSLLTMTAPTENNYEEQINQSSPVFESSPNDTHFIDYRNRSNKSHEELKLSKQLLNDSRTLIQLRQEMIAFYRMISRIKTCPKFDNLCKIILGLRSKYIERIRHEFLFKQVQNATYELDTLYSIFKSDSLICKYRYKEAVFAFYKVKHLLQAWSETYTLTNVPESNVSPPSPLRSKLEEAFYDSSPSSTSKAKIRLSHLVDEDYFDRPNPGVKKDSSFIGSLVHKISSKKSPPTAQEIESNTPPPTTTTPTIHSTNTSVTSTPTTTTTPLPLSSPLSSSDRNALTKTSLYMWMNTLFAFAVSKYTLYFRDILRTNMKSQFADLCSMGIIDYHASIESFANLVTPESVCIVLNCSEMSSSDEMYDLSSSYFELDSNGYSLSNRLNQEQTTFTSGIKSWPCIFNYPEDQNRQMLMMSHWPNLLSLIMDSAQKLDSDIEPLYFGSDAKSSYYVACVDPRIYFCVIFNYSTKTRPKVNKLSMEFVRLMNNYLRQTKLFSYLTSMTHSNNEQ
jgi:hypothetical protein